MVSVRRRALLRGACGLAAAAAGCSGLGGTDSESSSPTVTVRERPGETGSPAGSNPTAFVRRFDADRPPVWVGTNERPTAGRHYDRIDSEFIDSRAAVDRLGVDEEFDRTGIDEFLAETDFERETVYLQPVTLEECFTLTLCGVHWGADQISTDYNRLTRPYDERCAVDATVYEVWFIRLPEAIDTDAVNSFSTSIGSGQCDVAPVPTEREGGGPAATGGEQR
jgi:hypothetical protein